MAVVCYRNHSHYGEAAVFFLSSGLRVFELIFHCIHQANTRAINGEKLMLPPQVTFLYVSTKMVLIFCETVP
ncbi:hypothetical protein [Rubritalea tangerina]|uniref:hypothetical protein n=1 Tax=Rubritalea tangerina TaxID=430798 RepID=UPI00361B0F8F